MKQTVLFICTANAARSQMAEGYLRAKYGKRFDVFSAGTKQARVSSRAIAVMQEIGIDISHHRSKVLDEFKGKPIDIAVTLCDNAHAVCPVVPSAKKTIHKGFFDPHLTPGTDEEILAGYRRVRDEIVAWIDEYFGGIKKMNEKESQDIREMVRKGYATVAEGGCGCCGPSSCCTGADTAEQISGKIGYSSEEMDAVPDGANLGLGCGNPLAHSAIHEGDTVLDLGSGAGFDCFLASRKVGNTGRVIGVDMTPEMLARARQNANKAGITNVEFRLGEIESLPVADCAVDLIISNCVINLSPDKARVFSEAFRVLKPGGTLMISDIVLERDLPVAVLSSVAAYVGCLAGAVRKGVYLDLIRGAGFSEVAVLEESTYPIELMVNDPTAQAVLANLSIPKEELYQIGDSVRSVKVRAVKTK